MLCTSWCKSCGSVVEKIVRLGQRPSTHASRWLRQPTRPGSCRHWSSTWRHRGPRPTTDDRRAAQFFARRQTIRILNTAVFCFVWSFDVLVIFLQLQCTRLLARRWIERIYGMWNYDNCRKGNFTQIVFRSAWKSRDFFSWWFLERSVEVFRTFSSLKRLNDFFINILRR